MIVEESKMKVDDKQHTICSVDLGLYQNASLLPDWWNMYNTQKAVLPHVDIFMLFVGANKSQLSFTLLRKKYNRLF